jgi:putative restriction endonuclease
MKDEPNEQRGEWLLLSISDRRQYAGNRGYADEHGLKYSYDSLVPNSSRLRAADRVAIRDRKGIIAVAMVSRIESVAGTKDLLRCPFCGSARIKERVNKTPRFRCTQDHAFDTPVTETRSCTQFTAFFDEFWSLTEPVPPERYRGACPHFNGQLSIQLINLDSVSSDLLAAMPADASPGFFRATAKLMPDEASATQITEELYIPSFDEAREKVMRQIGERRGQKVFREKLTQQYGSKCVVSGCNLLDILEAAHIRPYCSPRDNHMSNGLLLRCDLHTLFDLNLLAIEPATLTVHLHPEVVGHGYDVYAGMAISCHSLRPSSEALNLRWQVFLAALAEYRKR